MKFLKTYQLFEFVENKQNTPLIYKDENLEVKVVKTFDACKEQGKDTQWCSNLPSGFYKHNKTANMYRFNFKDGYKLRLTWEYIKGQGQGTHWGCGGKVNGEAIWYRWISPEDESEPFLFDYNKNDNRQEMVDRINSIPQGAIDVVHEYQNKSSIEKSANLTKLYSEIQKIKVLGVEEVEILTKSGYNLYGDTILVKIEYNGKVYQLAASADDFGFISSKYHYNKFIKDFKNKYVSQGNELVNYLYDKVKEFLKKNKNVSKSQIFESNNDSVIKFLRDMSLELTDDGYDIIIKDDSWNSDTSIFHTGGFLISVEKESNVQHDLPPFKFNSISDFIHNSIEFMSDEGFKIDHISYRDDEGYLDAIKECDIDYLEYIKKFSIYFKR